MPQIKILVRKTLRTIDSRRSRPIAINEITALNHEVLDHSMELASLVALRSPKMILYLAGAILTEGLGRSWDCVREKLHFHAAERLAAEGDVEKDYWI